jgi:hypothetical protein
MRRSWLVVGVVAMILASGCAGRPEPRQTATGLASADFSSFAGVVRETGDYLAVAVLGGRARAFVCNPVNEIWFDGDVTTDGMMTMVMPKDKHRVGFFNLRQGSGAFWFNGRLRTFQAAPVDKAFGLYRAQSPNGQLVVGWVVLPNGDQVGAITNNATTDYRVLRLAPHIDPSHQTTVTIEGQQLALKSGLQQLSGGG